jgi:hypothetical protein
MMTQSIIQDAANESRASFIARYYKHTGNRSFGSLMAARAGLRCGATHVAGGVCALRLICRGRR